MKRRPSFLWPPALMATASTALLVTVLAGGPTAGAAGDTAPAVEVVGGRCVNDHTGVLYLALTDLETAAGKLTRRIQSNNQQVARSADQALWWSGKQLRLTVVATPTAKGRADLTLTVGDGLNETERTFSVQAGVPQAVGTDHNDVLFGAGSNSVLYGLGDRDLLCGGSGEDLLDGGTGADLLDGRDGADRLVGGAGRDNLRGGAGDDMIDGGMGADTIDAGPGDDDARGDSGDDVLYGGPGFDRLSGGTGHDQLFGQQGSDTLLGDDGDDQLDGGGEDDEITGGLGADVFTVVAGGRVTDYQPTQHDTAVTSPRS